MIKEISRRSRLYEQSPPLTLPLVEDLVYDRKKEFGYQFLLGIEPEGEIGYVNTKVLLRHLKSITGDLPDKAHPISMENYTKEVKRLREST